MIIDLERTQLFVRPGVTDLRKQINGLAIIVKQAMNQEPLSGSLFLFCNRERRILKALYWQRNGFCQWQKRLERDKFPWPATAESAQEISYVQLKMLLEGIDFWKAHKELSFSSVL
jgi:transposase